MFTDFTLIITTLCWALLLTTDLSTSHSTTQSFIASENSPVSINEFTVDTFSIDTSNEAFTVNDFTTDDFTNDYFTTDDFTSDAFTNEYLSDQSSGGSSGGSGISSAPHTHRMAFSLDNMSWLGHLYLNKVLYSTIPLVIGFTSIFALQEGTSMMRNATQRYHVSLVSRIFCVYPCVLIVLSTLCFFGFVVGIVAVEIVNFSLLFALVQIYNHSRFRNNMPFWRSVLLWILKDDNNMNMKVCSL